MKQSDGQKDNHCSFLFHVYLKISRWTFQNLALCKEKLSLFFFQGPYYWESLWDKTHIAIKQLKSQSKENMRSQLSKISHSITKCV